MDTNERIVIRLQEEMARQALTQKALALKAGLNETAVRDILKRRSRAPRVDTLEKLAAALGTTVDSLLGQDGEAPARPPPSRGGEGRAVSRIREIRKARGMTLKQLADKIGVTEVSASRYEKEDQRLTLPLMAKIAAALGCEPADLLATAGATPRTIFAERVATARKAAGLSQEELAKACGISRAAVAQWEGGETKPKHTNLAPVAAKLGVTVSWLLGEGDGEAGFAPRDEVDLDTIQPLPANATLARDLPVIGTAAGGDNGDFGMNGEIVDYVRRPPALAGLRDAFAIYLVGHSMEPRYDNGGLLFVHPGRPVSPGCDVLVELHDDHGQVGHCMVKTLVRRANGNYILQQYNPPRDDIEIPVERVKHIYRVLRNEELLGV